MKNKKAALELGKIITGFPVLILIIFVIGIFIAFSAGLSFLKGFEKSSPSEKPLQEENLLLKTIEIKTQGSEIKKLLFVDGIAENLQKGIPMAILRDEIAKFVNEKERCAIISVDNDYLFGYYINGKVVTDFVTGSDKLYNTLENAKYFVKIHKSSLTTKIAVTVNDKNHQLQAYSGGCQQ